MEIVQLNKMINAIKNFPKGSTTNDNIEKVYKYIQSLTPDSDNGAEVALDCGVIEPCPFCGSVAEHESTVCEETIRCQGCSARMTHNGSAEFLIARWNTREKVL